MKGAIYIDTRPGSGNLFSPPADIDDYTAWLTARYKQCQGRDGVNIVHYGVSQKVNEIIYSARHRDIEILAFGPHADSAAAVIEEIAEHNIQIEVLAS